MNSNYGESGLKWFPTMAYFQTVSWKHLQLPRNIYLLLRRNMLNVHEGIAGITLPPLRYSNVTLAQSINGTKYSRMDQVKFVEDSL